MKITSPPRNTHFYQRWRASEAGLFWLGLLGQLISLITEFFPIYALINSQLSQIMPGAETWKFSATIAALCAIGIEATLRSAGYRTFMIHWEKKAPNKEAKSALKGTEEIDRPLRRQIVATFVFLAILQQALSIAGSFVTVDVITPEAEQVDAAPIRDSIREAIHAQAAQIWKQDSLQIVAGFAGMIQAAQTAAEARELAATIQADNYARKPGNFQTAIARHRSEAAQARAAGAEQVQRLRQSQADSINRAWTTYKAGIDRSERQALAAFQATNSENAAAITGREQQVKSQGWYLVFGTIIGTSLLLLSLRATTARIYGSGQEIVIKESVYKHYPSIFAMFARSRTDRFLQRIYQKVTDYQDATQPPPLPMDEPERIDFTPTVHGKTLRVGLETRDGRTYLVREKTALIEEEEQPAPARRIGYGLDTDIAASSEKRYTLAGNADGDSRKRVTVLQDIRNSRETNRNRKASKCKQCGADLAGRRSDAQFCSDTCRVRHHRGY